jgi:thiosulfate dehydrogenase [quinone] large subunit
MDKLFGLGFATESANSWLNGGSPTTGFLKFATQGPFADFYSGLAGNAFVDWLFMLGLLLIGLALIMGVGVRIAGYAGALLMLILYSAALWPENNPFLDDHLIYAIAMIAFAHVHAGHTWGLGRWWAGTLLVQKNRWLE